MRVDPSIAFRLSAIRGPLAGIMIRGMRARFAENWRKRFEPSTVGGQIERTLHEAVSETSSARWDRESSNGDPVVSAFADTTWESRLLHRNLLCGSQAFSRSTRSNKHCKARFRPERRAAKTPCWTRLIGTRAVILLHASIAANLENR